MKSAKEKNIVIFGATSKIAYEVAKIWAKAGARLILVARNSIHLKTINDDLKCLGALDSEFIVSDLNDSLTHESLITGIVTKYGPIDIALLAHGKLGDQKDAEKSWASTEDILKTNFLSYASLLTTLANVLEVRGSGTLAVIGSVAGDRGRQSNYIYGTAKGAIEKFCQGLRNRLFKKGISVVLIKPGFIDTPMTAHLKKGPLFVSAHKIAHSIVSAIDSGKSTVYVPSFWRLILFVIRSIPEPIFKRLKL